jgi:hypothetical protein
MYLTTTTLFSKTWPKQIILDWNTLQTLDYVTTHRTHNLDYVTTHRTHNLDYVTTHRTHKRLAALYWHLSRRFHSSFARKRRVRKIAKSEYYLRHVFPSVRLSTRLSVCPQRTRLSLDGFSQNLVFEYFFEICPENLIFIKIGQGKGYFIWGPIYIFDHISLIPS